MSVPRYYEFYNELLESLNDDQMHYYRECFEDVKNKMHLTSEDIAKTIPSGEPTWFNRIGWCCSYLKKAGLIFNPKRAYIQITEAGKKLLAENIKITDELLIKRFPTFAEFVKPKSNINSETPQSLLESSFDKITNELSEELLTAILSASPKFFETLVVKLMEAMGYGGYEGAGFVTKSSGDSGIDGVIYEDKLGFNLIYIQAKRWSPDTVISRAEIQKFVGALAGPPKIEKGLFITTAKFSDAAKNYANVQHIILVDGKKLTELMIEFDVGVQTQKIYKIKRVDNDFFTE